MSDENLTGSIRQCDLDGNCGRVRVATAGNSVSVVFLCPQIEVKKAFRRSIPSVFFGHWTKLGKRDVYVVKQIKEVPLLTGERE